MGKNEPRQNCQNKVIDLFFHSSSASTMGWGIFRRIDTLDAMVIAFMLVLASTSVSSAQGVNFGNPAAPPPPTIFAPVPSPLSNLAGLREAFGKYGVTISGIYTGEVFANLSGGKRTGAIAEGLLAL